MTRRYLLRLGYVEPTPPPLPLSPPKSPSITPLPATLPTEAVVVEDTPPAILPLIPSDPPHIAPLPVSISDTLPAPSETNGASTMAGIHIQQPPVQTVVPSVPAVAHVVATPNSLPTINGSTSDVGTQSSRRRRRSIAGEFFKRLFHRP